MNSQPKMGTGFAVETRVAVSPGARGFVFASKTGRVLSLRGMI